VSFSARQRAALQEICDAFCPSADGLPTARQLGVADALIEAVEKNPRASERKQLAALLGLWDTAPMGALGGAGLKRFSAMSQDEREALLLNWADSRVPLRPGQGVRLLRPRLPGRREAVGRQDMARRRLWGRDAVDRAHEGGSCDRFWGRGAGGRGANA
jgi:hypothetical protein